MRRILELSGTLLALVQILTGRKEKHMFIGHSTSRGILMANTSRPAPNAVYGYHCGGEIVLKTGEYKALKAQQSAEKEPDKRQDNGSVRLFLGTIGVMLLLCVLVWRLFGFVNFLAALVFCVLAFFPLMIIVFTRRNLYKDDELMQQFRRHHGCEHAMLELLSKEKPATLENLKTSSIYDAECGSAYAGYFLTLACEIGLFLSTLVEIGFLPSVGILIATVILLLILIFVPWNPYKRIQRPVVAQPQDEEYELGMAILQELQRISACTENP